mmetsp:Transcript_8619/g.14572  ORF Transcript_8619/g.14572 Transcript_8619/m.14572 type:complete len:89 (-) Transcript_8619:259-525(-)
MQNILISIVWVMWCLNQFVNLVILLNFLIAVISQVYEKVISQQFTYVYVHKADLNYRIYTVLEFLNRNKPFKIIAFSVDKNAKEVLDG